MPISCAIVTDELSSDPLTAFELGREWGVRHFELRGMHAGRVPELDRHSTYRLRQAVKDFEVSITTISPGLFKFPHPAQAPQRANIEWMDRGLFQSWADRKDLLRYHLDTLLPASIEFADTVGADFIVGFSFSRTDQSKVQAPAAVIDTLGQAAEQVFAAGKTFLIETEEGFWADTGSNSLALVDAVGSTAAINWDPANVVREDEVPFPDGYRQIASRVRNVHFKDARRQDEAGVFVADGEVDWEGQIDALLQAGYDGCIAVEPHLSPSVSSVRTALQRLRQLIAAASSVPTL